MTVKRACLQMTLYLPRWIQRSHAGLLCGFTLAIFLVPGFATLVPRMTLEQMASDSQFIVHGTVTRKWTGWDGAGQFIWTHYEIRVEESLKGDSGGTVVVSEPGGVVGEEGMHIAGAPQYNPGEEVVLLVWRTPTGYLRTCGWGQGTFTVSQEPGAAVKTVRAPGALRGVELVEAGAKGAGNARALGTPPSALDGLPLADFKSRLRVIAASMGGGR